MGINDFKVSREEIFVFFAVSAAGRFMFCIVGGAGR
jgi:hypothetical protein